LKTASDLDQGAVHEIEGELRRLLADTFVLDIKTKNFHWHMKGRHFRDYHLLLDEHADQLFGITDEIAERARKLGAATLRSIGDITRHQRLQESDRENVAAEEMLEELRSDNRQLTRFLRATHEVCERHDDVATASLIEVWIDQAERRAWFLAETVSGIAAEKTASLIVSPGSYCWPSQLARSVIAGPCPANRRGDGSGAERKGTPAFCAC
jgi:starvation-inducible DNA-binding protein